MLSRSILRTARLHAPRRALHTQTSGGLSRSSTVYATAATLAFLASTGYIFARPLELDGPKGVKGAKGSGHARGATQTPQAEEQISYQEVQKHNKREDCWIVVRGQVYNVTDFIPKHPGGDKIIVSNAGKDVTEIFESLHAKGTLEKMLKPSQHVGSLDPSTAPAKSPEIEAEEQRVAEARAKLPPLSHVLNLNEFEELAQGVLNKTAWSYYRSAADDEFAHMNNALAFRRYWFRPRVLRGTKTIDTSCEILGNSSTLPVFVSPAAMAGLGAPEGELNITKGAGRMGIIQGISSNASRSVDEIAEARVDGAKQPLFFQLYVASDRAKSEKVIKHVEELGYRAIFFTVDAPVLGNRELDQRNRANMIDTGDDDEEEGQKGGVASTIDGYFDAGIDWSTLKWLKKTTKLPIILKGVQTVEDVELAAQHGVNAVLLSNHGGRQLDYAPAAIDVLYELRQKRPDLFDKMEIYVDGGVRRGTDVLKAMCLGAKGVGLGRTFLFANGTYGAHSFKYSNGLRGPETICVARLGEKGVVKAIRILRNEIETGMRLLGVTRLDQLGPEMVEKVPYTEMPSGLYRSRPPSE
ncbi:FMN-dependent alpha-hydroxy acid dehydrogenase [Ceratobasidium sp. AG-Ba]|nr:FMN-dependent alpha-hydroxy acid dehydrogenase [Ceratobasidium sp. AG-Ba]